MVSLVLMCLFIAISLGIFGFAIFKAIRLVKHPMPKTINYLSEIKKLLYLIGAVSLSTVVLFVFLVMYQKYPLIPADWASLIFGSFFFALTLSSATISFILHYYGKEVPEKLDKGLFITLIASGITFFFALTLLTNGLADYLIYPLVNGFNFQEGFVTPNMGGIKPNLAWYAICILGGALLCYAICDHRFYVEYKKHGILESTLFVAFPAGIIGARVGYVIGEWEHGGFAERVAAGEWWSIFAIWEGGLTVISGALVGIIVGVAWFLWRNKKYSIWLAMDVIIPCILVAQAVGRWGNFFNCEVHGTLANASDWWFLPKIVLNNATFTSSTAEFAPAGMIYVPLFFVEFITNLLGYFIIRFVFGKFLKKYIEFGDLSAGYIIWYGLTRVIMEPMRHTAYNMGNDGYWSWMWSIIFVLVGSLLIAINHVVRYLIKKKLNKPMIAYVDKPVTYAVMSVLFLIGLGLSIAGTILMSRNTQSNFLGFNLFNNGFILLTIGLSFLLIITCGVIYSLQGRKKKYRVILFDMDGTVLDSDPMILEAMNILYDKYRDGNRTPKEQVVYFSGPPIRETLKKEFPNQDNAFMFDEFHKESIKLYPTHTFKYPHSKEVLLKLKKEGFKLGIVTNKLHHLTEYALECIGLDGIFEYIVGFDDVKNGKPNAEGILKAIEYFKGQKEESIYIGDNKSDYDTARNAKIDCCLVNWGPRVLPSDLTPEYKINSYLELEGILYE